jgi:hypothetical protein
MPAFNINGGMLRQKMLKESGECGPLGTLSDYRFVMLLFSQLVK